MNRKFFLCVLMITIIILFVGCEDKDMSNYDIANKETGIFYNKNWSEMVGSYTKDIIPDEETAVKMANIIFKNLQKEGYCKNYSLQEIFFDEEDKIWILSYWESTDEMITGSDCSIALKKSNGEVLRIWFGE